MFSLTSFLTAQDVINVVVHVLCAVLAHLIGKVGIGVHGKGSGGVPHVALNGFHIISRAEGGNGIAMPLRYNYDKPKNRAAK